VDDRVETLRALGIPEEAIERAVRRGDPEGAIFDAVLLPQIEARTVSATDIESRGGLTVDELVAMVRAFGLPPPEPNQPAFTPEEAQVFVELKRLQEIWPPELGLQLGRVYGRQLGRIAQTGVQLFRLYVEPRLRAEGAGRLAGLRAVQSAFQELLPLADPLLVGVHTRWVEHELAQAAVSEAEAGVGGRSLPGVVEVAFLFCDLKDFTAYADSEGDAAAVRAIDRFIETVTRERGQFRFMKALGDGCMLVYPDACRAVEVGSRIIDGVKAPAMPGVHASVHEGLAIVREGDYFGGAVNLAARLLAAAGRDELLATGAVVERCGAFRWQAEGSRRMRGVQEPVEVFRLDGDRRRPGEPGIRPMSPL
jgi:class 3 adenylate cyclase